MVGSAAGHGLPEGARLEPLTSQVSLGAGLKQELCFPRSTMPCLCRKCLLRVPLGKGAHSLCLDRQLATSVICKRRPDQGLLPGSAQPHPKRAHSPISAEPRCRHCTEKRCWRRGPCPDPGMKADAAHPRCGDSTEPEAPRHSSAATRPRHREWEPRAPNSESKEKEPLSTPAPPYTAGAWWTRGPAY